MSAQHTPGPWRLLPAEDVVPYLRIRGTRLGARYKVANVLAQNYFPQDAIETDAIETDAIETDANARLIAAAPDLLEALKDFTDNPRRLTETERQQNAIAVIAKATGEKQ